MPAPVPGISKDRLGALADGVFAFAMTLLVLDIRVPDLPPDAPEAELIARLLRLWPKVLAYAISFMSLGVFWVAHYGLHHFVARVDRPFLWLNLVLLALVGGMPFSTALLSEHHRHAAPVILYCGHWIAAGLLFHGLFRYAVRPGRLIAPDLDPAVVRAAERHWYAGLLLYAVALVLSPVHTGLSLAICTLVPVFYLRPGRVDRLLGLMQERSRTSPARPPSEESSGVPPGGPTDRGPG